eukprot:s3340_g4.t1
MRLKPSATTWPALLLLHFAFSLDCDRPGKVSLPALPGRHGCADVVKGAEGQETRAQEGPPARSSCLGANACDRIWCSPRQEAQNWSSVANRSEEPGSDRLRTGRDEDEEEFGRPRLHRRVVDPQHPGKAVWDVGISIMIVYSVLVEPFRICFGVEISSAMLAIDIFVDCLFVIDIVLTFFTAYLDEREVLVTNRLRIAQRYLRGFFVIDVASVFPAELFLLAIQPDIATQARAVKLLRLVRLMKLGRLFKLKRLVLLVEEKLNFSLQVMDMLKMLVKVLFIVHWLACLTFLVASPVCADGTAMPCPPPEGPNDDTRFWSNWVRMFQVDKFDLAARYLSTFHFITATLMAVGYGDIFPANSFERIVCIVSQITGAVLFGFLLSCITAVLEFTHPRELEHKKRMSEIKDRMQGLRVRWFQGRSPLHEDEHTMLLSLPTHLRSQLVESSQKMYFQAIQASLGNFEKGLVAELAVQVMPMQVPYHMCILEDGATGELTTELYVVATGRVEAVLVEERHNENPEQLEAFLKLCLASSDPRRNGGGVAREDLFDEPSGNSLPDASADGEEARPRAERTRRRQATPTRGLIQRARSFLTEGVGFAAPAPSEDTGAYSRRSLATSSKFYAASMENWRLSATALWPRFASEVDVTNPRSSLSVRISWTGPCPPTPAGSRSSRSSAARPRRTTAIAEA